MGGKECRDALLSLIAEHGVKQSEIAKGLGVSAATISGWLGGQVIPVERHGAIDEFVRQEISRLTAKSQPTFKASAGVEINEIRERVRPHSEVYGILRGMEDGTRFIMLAAAKPREIVAMARAADFLEGLRSSPRSTWLFLHPSLESSRKAKRPESIESAIRDVQGTQLELQKLLKSKSFSEGLEGSDPSEYVAIVKDRIAVQALEASDYFHPIVKTLLVIPPRGISGSSGQPHGWLEIPFYHSGLIPAMILMSDLEVDEMLSWLLLSGVDVTPRTRNRD